MAQSSWSDLYDQASAGGAAGIAEGTYEVEVSDVRTLARSRMLFLDLKVVSGPLAGSETQVSLYIPAAGSRGALFHFRKKIQGFGDLSAAFRQMDQTEDVESALQILADALVGRRVTAEIGLVSEGDYKGSNELRETKPSDAPASAAQTAAAAPAPAAAANPAMSGEVPF